MLAISGLNITHKKGYARGLSVEISGLLDHLRGLEEHMLGDGEAEVAGRLEVDHEVELAGPLHGQAGRVGAFEDFVHVDRGGAVPWRQGRFGSNSAAGSRLAERLLTVVASCGQQGRRLLDLLVAAGEAALQGTAARSLLPTRPR